METATERPGAGQATCNFGLLTAALRTAVAAGSQGAEMLGPSEVVGACASVAQEIADGVPDAVITTTQVCRMRTAF